MIERISSLVKKDGYKADHRPQYPVGTEFVSSNLTPRKSRAGDNDGVIFFGLQYFAMEYLIDGWNRTFFSMPKETVVGAYKRRMDNYLGKDAISINHIEELHDLGYLPIKVKALPEGTFVPFGIPVLTIINTNKRFFWLTNFLETIISDVLWKPTTSATTAFEYRKRFEKHAKKTGYDASFVKWQGHDFSFRGMSGFEDALMSGAGHLLSFTGTDTIPAIDFLEMFYGANSDTELIGGSVPATEHSVMSLGSGFGSEAQTIERLITEVYPTGVASIVCDTFDFWEVIDVIIPSLKHKIMAREGRVVVRPDSGDPVKIICGSVKVFDYKDTVNTIEMLKLYAKEKLVDEVRNTTAHGEQGECDNSGYFRFDGKVYKIEVSIDWNRYDKQYYYIDESKIQSCEEVQLTSEQKGAWECLWDTFGGTINEKGYKCLDTHIGLIYGDAISRARQNEILTLLEEKGFAFCNGVLGLGSFTYEFVTRDTNGFAMKATWGMVNGVAKDIFKDPKTDRGFKKSAKGLLMVYSEDGVLKLKDQCTAEEEELGLLETVFLNGYLVKVQTLAEIRARVEENLLKYA